VDDPFTELRDRLESAALTGPGETDAELRRAIAADCDVPAPLAELVD
jgi:hypothetical protein